MAEPLVPVNLKDNTRWRQPQGRIGTEMNNAVHTPTQKHQSMGNTILKEYDVDEKPSGTCLRVYGVLLFLCVCFCLGFFWCLLVCLLRRAVGACHTCLNFGHVCGSFSCVCVFFFVVVVCVCVSAPRWACHTCLKCVWLALPRLWWFSQYVVAIWCH
jgi:hypothetical protein